MTQGDPLRADPLSVAQHVLGAAALAELAPEDIGPAVRRRIVEAINEQDGDQSEALREIEAPAASNGTSDMGPSEEAESVGLCGRCFVRAVLVATLVVACVLYVHSIVPTLAGRQKGLRSVTGPSSRSRGIRRRK